MAKEITVNGKGKIKASALLSDCDIARVCGHSWYINTHGYIQETRTGLLLHRLVMNAPKGVQVDHINGDKLDNRRENLRLCDNTQNSHNQQRHVAGQSKYKGVRRNGKRWQAQIAIFGIHKTLGTHDTEAEAALAYNAAARHHFGVFARLNEVEGKEPSYEEVIGRIGKVGRPKTKNVLNA